MTPASASRNRVRGVDDLERDPGRGDEVALDLLGLALTQQPVVDEHAGELVADRTLHERGRDRRVHPAGETADDALAADLRADRVDLLVDDVGGGPGRLEPGDVVEEVLEDAPDRARCAGPRGGTALRRAARLASSKRRDRRRPPTGGDDEPLGRARTPSRRGDIHTDCSRGQAARRAASRVDHAKRRTAELGQPGLRDRAAQRQGHRLEAVADAERGDAGLEEAGSTCGAPSA